MQLYYSFSKSNPPSTEAEGYRFMRERVDRNEKGIVIYDVEPSTTTSTDELAFGFMTYHKNGTLVRLDSSISADFIEIKMVGVAIMYDIPVSAVPGDILLLIYKEKCQFYLIGLDKFSNSSYICIPFQDQTYV